MKTQNHTCLMRCEPATDLEIHKIQRAREQGKSPKPSWYSPPKMPKSFEPELRQQYPAYVRAMLTRQSFTEADRKIPENVKTLKAYILEFEKLNGLRHVKIEWVKTEGNFV